MNKGDEPGTGAVQLPAASLRVGAGMGYGAQKDTKKQTQALLISDLSLKA
jgi:hypothetical protein